MAQAGFSFEQREILTALQKQGMCLKRVKGEFPFVFVLRPWNQDKGGVYYRSAPVTGLLTRGFLVEDATGTSTGIWLTTEGLEAGLSL